MDITPAQQGPYSVNTQGLQDTQEANAKAYDKVRSRSKEERDQDKADKAMDDSMAAAKRKSDKLSLAAQRAANGAVDTLNQFHGENGTEVNVPVIRGSEDRAGGGVDGRTLRLTICNNGVGQDETFFIQ